MRVVYFFRNPTINVSNSIEISFEASRSCLPSDIETERAICRFKSRGFWRRAFNAVGAVFHQGNVNHITGDVHYLSFFLQKRKTVLTVHDCVFETRMDGLKRWLMRLLWYRIPACRVAVLTTVSQFTKDRLVQQTRCHPDKVQVVPTCIAPQFRAIDKPFNATCPTILQVGTSENKNLERLVDALTGIPCRLRIIGKISPAQRARLEASGLDFTNEFNLSDEDMVRCYGDSDIIAFVSTYEGFGMPIIEANTVGRAVVTGNVASMPEVAGDAACLVDPFDIAAIRAGILKVIADAPYRETLIRNGFRNRLRFLPNEVARRYAEIYRSLAGGAAPAWRPSTTVPRGVRG